MSGMAAKTPTFVSYNPIGNRHGVAVPICLSQKKDPGQDLHVKFTIQKYL